MQARENKKKRKEDTRRKILAGAAVLDEAETNIAYKNALYELLERFLTRPDDRALFGLPPQPDSTLKQPKSLPATLHRSEQN